MKTATPSVIPFPARLTAVLLACVLALFVCVPSHAQAGRTLVRTPQASGATVYGNSTAGFDASNTSQGYIIAWYSGAAGKVKLQITGNGGATYTYNLSTSGKKEVFPLTAGNGSYTVNIYERVSGDQYALAFGQNISVSLTDQFLPFLYPNQFVNFNSSSNAVALAGTLASTATDDIGVISNVYNYVISHVTYDTGKANTISQGGMSGYLPSVDSTLSTGTGICFDYAALMAAMLRSQQIPTRLEVGYVSGGIYHAWISTYIPEVGWVNGIIQFDGQNWKLMDPTFASNGSSSDSIMQFIGNGSNYSTKYRY